MTVHHNILGLQQDNISIPKFFSRCKLLKFFTLFYLKCLEFHLYERYYGLRISILLGIDVLNNGVQHKEGKRIILFSSFHIQTYLIYRHKLNSFYFQAYFYPLFRNVFGTINWSENCKTKRHIYMHFFGLMSFIIGKRSPYLPSHCLHLGHSPFVLVLHLTNKGLPRGGFFFFPYLHELFKTKGILSKIFLISYTWAPSHSQNNLKGGGFKTVEEKFHRSVEGCLYCLYVRKRRTFGKWSFIVNRLLYIKECLLTD